MSGSGAVRSALTVGIPRTLFTQRGALSGDAIPKCNRKSRMFRIAWLPDRMTPCVRTRSGKPHVWHIRLEGIRPAPRGAPQVEVTFDIDGLRRDTSEARGVPATYRQYLYHTRIAF